MTAGGQWVATGHQTINKQLLKSCKIRSLLQKKHDILLSGEDKADSGI